MTSIIIAALWGGAIMSLFAWSTGWLNPEYHEAIHFRQTADLCGEIDALNKEIRRLTALQQPRLPNGRFKGREK